MAKAIEEEERNIGVAFILPFTLTCVCVRVCVCVCVCVYVCTTEFEDRVVIIHAQQNKTEEERYLFFVARSFFFCFLDLLNAHITIRERRRE